MDKFRYIKNLLKKIFKPQRIKRYAYVFLIAKNVLRFDLKMFFFLLKLLVLSVQVFSGIFNYELVPEVEGTVNLVPSLAERCLVVIFNIIHVGLFQCTQIYKAV